MSTRQMTAIKCDDCGADSFVPFIPDGKRPVYCGPCHKKHRDKEKAESAAHLEEEAHRVIVYDRNWRPVNNDTRNQ